MFIFLKFKNVNLQLHQINLQKINNTISKKIVRNKLYDQNKYFYNQHFPKDQIYKLGNLNF